MQGFTQPQLGKTIQSLRQEKRLTQDELVEKCNLNVRTLQRIEAGEVTPRDYTIKAIFNALDYQFERIEASLRNKEVMRRLTYAWIAGLIYFLSGLGEGAVEFLRFERGMPFYFPLIYTTIKVLVLASYTIFMIGFVEMGRHYSNALLRIAAYLLMGSMAVIVLFDVVSIFSGMSGEEFIFVKGLEGVAFGGVNVVFGVALFMLGDRLGIIIRATGIIEVMAGVLFVSFFLGFLGLFLLIPATILEVIVLYRVLDKVRIAEMK